MLRAKLAILSLSLTAFLGGFIPASGQEVLRWQVPQGQRFQLEMQSDTEMSHRGGGESSNHKVEVLIEATLNVTEVAEGKVTFNVRFDRARMHLEENGTVTEFDSMKEQPQDIDPDTQEMMERLIGSELQISIDARGRVQEMDLPEALLEGLGPGPGDPLQAKEALKSTLNIYFFPVFPEGAIEQDATWTEKLAFPVPSMEGGGMDLDQIEIRYRHAGREQIDGRQLIKIESNIRPPGPEGSVPPELKGTAWFDSRGFIHKSMLEIDVSHSSEFPTGERFEMESTSKFQLTMRPSGP